jgi:hypothetical protein
VTIPLATTLGTSAQITLRRDVSGITDGGHRRSHIMTFYSGDLPMNCFRACLFSSALLVFLVLAAAVQPTVAQTAHGKQMHHQTIPAGKTCSDCHKMTYAQWKGSKHGTNGVECTVCHGEITAQSVAATPALSTCDTCHGEQVAQLNSDPFKQGKTCVTCHAPHTFMGHPKTAPAGKK